jgi:hypothetical protein
MNKKDSKFYVMVKGLLVIFTCQNQVMDLSLPVAVKVVDIPVTNRVVNNNTLLEKMM